MLNALKNLFGGERRNCIPITDNMKYQQACNEFIDAMLSYVRSEAEIQAIAKGANDMQARSAGIVASSLWAKGIVPLRTAIERGVKHGLDPDSNSFIETLENQ